MAIDGSAVGRRRLRAQGLAGELFDSPADVVRWCGALQAQDYGQSLWAIGSRLRRPSLAAVEEAVAAGEILRTWPMRGTIHWVPAADAAWMVELSAARTVASVRTRMAGLGVDATTVTRAGEVLFAELTGGRRLSRPQVMALWTSAGIDISGQRGYSLLWQLAHAGAIAIGPMAGKQQTFVLLSEWAAAPQQLSRADGLAELARRYVQSHGPATAHDFAWWAGLTMADARAGLAGSGFAAADEFWSAEAPNPRRTGAALLLAGFDEFVLGYQRRSDALEAEFADRVVPGNNGIFQPCLVIDGQVAGTWKRAVRRGAVDIAVSLFRPGSVQNEQLAAAAGRYAAYLDVPLGAVVTE